MYEDFSSYSGGVYIKRSDRYAGAHAVACIGWGSEGGVPYATLFSYMVVEPKVGKREAVRRVGCEGLASHTIKQMD